MHHIFRSFEGLRGAVLAQAGNRALLLATQGFREGWIRRGGCPATKRGGLAGLDVVFSRREFRSCDLSIFVRRVASCMEDVMEDRWICFT